MQPESAVLVLVGDSTVTQATTNRDEAGWGWALGDFARPGLAIHNTAVGGRSSRSFRAEGRWDQALAHQPDWMLIQFGHNDCPGKGPHRESDPATDFRTHLRAYVADARERGAKPVLITPVCRRRFDAAGGIDDGLAPYAEATRAVASEQGVPCLDLYGLSCQRMIEMGPAAAARLGPSDAPEDATHFSRSASRTVAGWVIELLQNVPDLGRWFNKP